MTPTPKQRAVTMKRNGMDDSLVGAVLGISAADVRALLYEADPDVTLGVPGTPVDVTPALDPAEVPNQGVSQLSDLASRTAPTDAPVYIFSAFITLRSQDGAQASLTIFGPTDAEAFDAAWNGPSTILRSLYRYLKNTGAEPVTQTETIEYVVGAGETIYFMQTGGTSGAPEEHAFASLNGGLWTPA